MSRFPGVPLIAPDGTEVECEERPECDPPKCPSWVDTKGKFAIAGAFLMVDGQLVFQLANQPRPLD